MGSPAYFGKLATFLSSQRKPALVPFGLFNAQDNLGFIADLPGAGGAGTVFSQATSAFSSSLVVDTSAANVITVNLTANVTTMTLNFAGSGTIPNGTWIYLRMVQDATGGRTVVFPSNLIVDQAFAVDPGANRATILPIQRDNVLSKWKFFAEPFSVQTA